MLKLVKNVFDQTYYYTFLFPYEAAGQMCPEDVKMIGKWNYLKHVHPKDDMTDLGRHELRSLGSRLRETFPEVLKIDPE